MTDHAGGSAIRRAMAWAVTLTVVSLSAAAAEPQYVLQDVRISGKQIHAFADGSEQVTVVLDDFQLVLGERSVSGRDAVLWIRQHNLGQAERHDITVYVEGDAKFVEPDGTITGQTTMLVTLHQQGRISAGQVMAGRPLADLPLYRRALEAREKAKSQPWPQELQTTTPDRRPPTLVVQTPPARDEAPTGAVPATPGEAPRVEPTSTAAQQVTFHAENITSQQRGDERIIIARGEVYLSQGDPDSALFLELRAQAAVLFTEKRMPDEKDTRSPLAPRLGGVETALPGPEGAVETVTGVYLEGDVIIARGERYLRGPSAYYDFTTDRAIVPDPVFRTIQKQRNIPIYIRAEEGRALSIRELWFSNAKTTTSDFYSPTYHIGASRAYLMDKTEYDPRGVALTEPSWHAKMQHTTFNIRGVPVLYLPYLQGDFTQGNSPLRKGQIGQHGRFGFGAETEWFLFRLLGLLEPAGYKGRFELDWYERGVVAGVSLKYARRLENRQYSGYSLLYGVFDDKQRDDFGDDRENIAAPRWRGRLLVRHKELLPRDWQLQFELSYLCDRNFLEEFFPDEFHAGKEQETLLYAKKQRDNWVFTTLLKHRLNRFDTQTEAVPDLGFHLIGQPLLNQHLVFYSESRAGFVRYRPAKGSGANDSRIFPRADTRNELDLPLHVGAVNVVPYVVGRATWWDDAPVGGKHGRPYGQAGARANMHFWRVYDNVSSRIWDVNRLRHIITPEVTAFASTTGGVERAELFPMDPDIEEHLGKLCGVSFGVHQRLQTKRGRPGDQHTVDWMRLAVVAGFYDGDLESLPADGRSFVYRPEYSLARDHINADYAWHISDATTFLADANYDGEHGDFRRANAGFAVSRDPRLRYYAGMRWIRDLDSAVGTLGVNYRLTRKYSLSFFQQYDFEFEGGRNLVTSVNITRKLPRWYVSFGFTYDQTQDDIGLYVTFWPEGIPEVKLGGQRLSLVGRSDKN